MLVVPLLLVLILLAKNWGSPEPAVACENN